MVNDGCFLLEFMRSVKSLKRGDIALSEYAPNDPVFSMRGLLSKYARIYSDVLLMENQIPLLVLKQLLTVVQDQYGTPATDEGVNNLVLEFLGIDKEPLFNNQQLGMHPLDIFHISLCGPRLKSPEWHGWVDTVPSAMELGETGIHFKRSNTNKLCDIDFKNSVLSMPQIVVRDGTKKEFLNLMAFEHLHRDIVTNVSVTDFVSFMDNIIDTEADVELLKKTEVIEHTLGTNMEVANMFNTMKTDAMMSPYGKLAKVKGEVNMYKWRASFIQTKPT
nr:unnamed protein product [Digitaria exilis]